MIPVFADTFYWIALLNPQDDWHSIALHFANNNTRPLITTDGIIDETLNYTAERGSLMRQKALLLYRRIVQEPSIDIIGYTPELRQQGIELYERRRDKGYSLTDCISMIVMRQLELIDVLTRDRHFTQEGFHLLF
jgi:predicted nucleic acid-binding protein